MDDPADDDLTADQVIEAVERIKRRYPATTSMAGRLLFVPRKLPPPRLYKYTTASTAMMILEGASLRYTQSEVLDDVFEEAPPREAVRQAMPEFEDGPTLIVDVKEPEDRLVAFDRVWNARNQMRKEGAILIDDTLMVTTGSLRDGRQYELGNRSFKYILEELRRPLALSLTESENSPRMWAEYGDSSKGVCLAFDSRSKYFRANRDILDRGGFFSEIQYREMTISDYAYRFPAERFFIKSPTWSDQREWRRIEFVTRPPGFDWHNEVITFPIPAESLVEVILGARCSETDCDSIVQAITAKSDFGHMGISKLVRKAGHLEKEVVKSGG